MSRLDVRTQLTHTHQPQLFNLTVASELQTQGMRLRQHVGRKKGLGLGEEYMNNIEVQRRKQHPERVGAPGELGNKDISPGSSDLNTEKDYRDSIALNILEQQSK